MPIHFGEEFGWRGYLQLRLFPQKPVMSAVVTKLIWAVWHYPATLRGYDFPDHPILGSLFVFPAATILLSIIFGWLRLKSGSTWAPSLAHSATNVFGASTLLFLFGGGLNSVLISYLGLLARIPLGALSAWIVFTGQLRPESDKSLQTKTVAQQTPKMRLAVE
jgi:membrane protease YdiL (CAAX protease family)